MPTSNDHHQASPDASITRIRFGGPAEHEMISALTLLLAEANRRLISERLATPECLALIRVGCDEEFHAEFRVRHPRHAVILASGTPAPDRRLGAVIAHELGHLLLCAADDWQTYTAHTTGERTADELLAERLGIELLRRCGEYELSYGGHPMALQWWWQGLLHKAQQIASADFDAERDPERFRKGLVHVMRNYAYAVGNHQMTDNSTARSVVELIESRRLLGEVAVGLREAASDLDGLDLRALVAWVRTTGAALDASLNSVTPGALAAAYERSV